MISSVVSLDKLIYNDDISINKSKIKPSLYSRDYAKACNEWRGLHDQAPGQWATQLQRKVAAVACVWGQCTV